jgi:enoyl-CoA hydratase/carnithine racemase
MSLVNLSTEGHVLKMSLNRPDKMNAFNLGMLSELAEAFTQLEDDPELRCGFLYYEGAHFTSGLDLAEVGPAVQKGDSLFNADLVDPVQVSGRKRTKPVVMAVGGYCLTIGMELILANDICVAHTETTFGQIEIKRGIFPFGGATVRMPQRCGWGNAMRYLLTGDHFSSEEALRIGFVQQVADDPIEVGAQIANTIARQAPLGVYATLASGHETLENGQSTVLASLHSTARKLMESEDAREGLRSFIERRVAQFKGK